MAIIHSSSTFDYKIVESDGKFITCFRSKVSPNLAWNDFSTKSNTMEEAVGHLKLVMARDEEKISIQNGGIDFDLNPKPEPDAAV